jgi:hypothetical protein
MSKDEPKVRTLHIKPRDLWPSTIYVGATVIKFMCGPRGRRVKVEHSGKRKPRHRRVGK